jgi:hypothetical protein
MLPMSNFTSGVFPMHSSKVLNGKVVMIMPLIGSPHMKVR